MHDPSTLVFDIEYPWKSNGHRQSFISIWHNDPETDGSDDSCGWFLRARHVDKAVLEKIISAYEFDWDSMFEEYECGFFKQDGQPHLSVMGVTLNLFRLAALEIFKDKQKLKGWDYQKKAMRYLQKNLADILFFAENPCDSLFNDITRKFQVGCNEEYTPELRDERLHSMAVCIYTYIMRDLRPWYKHPKWHIHHWEVHIKPIRKIKRLFKDMSKRTLNFIKGNKHDCGNRENNAIKNSV